MKNMEYTKWIESHNINPEIKKELFLMSESEIYDAFNKKIEFGTAGLRGKIGPGSNRINHYVIAKTTIGFINYLKEKYPTVYERGIVIAYDNRRFSKEFSVLVANLFARAQINVYLFEEMRPTPQLSFMIRHLKCCAGINITASHNPKTDNGYKVYDSEGCQILPNEITKIVKHIDAIKNELDIDIENFENSDLIHFLDKNDDKPFINAALKNSINHVQYKGTGMVYTPLHGTGGTVIPALLKKAGYSHIFPVEEQMVEDDNFSTVPSPNPEDINAFTLGIDKANQIGVNYVLATDPDADRIGVCIRKKNSEFKLLTGNELGAILLEYILSSRKELGLLRNNSVMIDTIVTSDLGKSIANKYNLYTLSVLTGFKYIGDLITEFDKNNEYHFEFGYEESLGFLANDYIRDKDAVGISLLIVEMINFYESNEQNLLDILDEIYEEHGYYRNKQISIALEAKNATSRIETIMNYFRDTEIESIIDSKLFEKYDYEKQTVYRGKDKVAISLPSSNVIKLILEDKSWIAIRPSGTEPKIKFYLAAKAKTKEECDNKILSLQNYINDTLDQLIR